MGERMTNIMEASLTVLEAAAALLLMLGFVIATVKWFRARGLGDPTEAKKAYRRSLARTTLIGLEVLLAATIIKTVLLRPTFESMGILMFMVVIRTALGWTTTMDMTGRWPWQKL